MENSILNRVAQSSIISIDLKEFYPKKDEYEIFDIADFLFERLILKEKDFRQKLKELDYSKFQNKYVSIFCSEDVIIPQWAYLLACIHLKPYAKIFFFGDERALIQKILMDKVQNMDMDKMKDKPVVIKGCADVQIDIEVYMFLTDKLMEVAKSIMYGEPCSNVPLYKKSKI